MIHLYHQIRKEIWFMERHIGNKFNRPLSDNGRETKSLYNLGEVVYVVIDANAYELVSAFIDEEKAKRYIKSMNEAESLGHGCGAEYVIEPVVLNDSTGELQLMNLMLEHGNITRLDKYERAINGQMIHTESYIAEYSHEQFLRDVNENEAEFERSKPF